MKQLAINAAAALPRAPNADRPMLLLDARSGQVDGGIAALIQPKVIDQPIQPDQPKPTGSNPINQFNLLNLNNPFDTRNPYM